jgi:small subunit ribosomal protein S1
MRRLPHAANLRRRYMTDTQTLTPPRPVEGSDGLLLEIDGQIVPNYDATLVPFEEGDVVTGKVVRIDQDEVLVDIGYKSEGVIPSNELSIRKSVDPHDEVELGEEVDALVLTKEDQDGRLLLSKKRARFEKAWRRIEAAAESGEPVEGNVIEVVKGGLIIDLGVRGFLPASLVDIRRVQDLDEFMSQKIECKVIELNRSRNNVVLSRRAVLEEERKEVRQQILDRLQPGQVVEGSISNIVDFGAFVDLDGIDGLIHISELSWSHVNHPSEILSIGDTVPVKVLDIDRDRQRISLGLKQTQEDPWQRVVDTYNIGDELEGKVTKVVTFGAFVEIMDGVEGLVHISELAHHHVENPREVVEPGADVKVKVLEIDSERRRLSLSIKRVAGNEPPPDAGGSTGGSTLGRVPDLGLSDEMFAGPSVTGAEDLRAVMVATSEATPEEGGAEAPADDTEATAEDAAPVDEAPAEAAAAAEDAPAEEEAPADEEPAEETASAEEAPAEDAPADEPAEDAAPADGEEPAEASEADSETDEG